MSSPGEIILRVELPQPLAQVLIDVRRRDELEGALRDEIGRLAATLGVPGHVVADVGPAPAAPRASAISGIRVYVGSTLCRFTLEQVSRVWALVHSKVLARAPDAEILDSLQAQGGAITQFVALLARESVSRDPSVLLGPAQVEQVAAAIGIAPTQRDRLGIILRDVLSLGISIGELAARPDLVALPKDPALPAPAAAESLIAALKSATIDIHLSPAELRRLTVAAGPERDRLALARDGLFYEIGLRFPNFRFIEDTSLAAHSFAFRVNSVLGLPWIGLASDEQLVNDSAEKIASRFGVPARPAANPYDGEPFAVGVSVPRASNLTTWTAFEYLVLCLSVELRRLAPWLLDEPDVVCELDLLGQAFPTIVSCARSRYSNPQLVRVSRALVEERLTIRDLRLLLTALVDFDTIVTDPSYIVVDDRLPVREAPADPPPTELLVAAVRSAQKRYITYRYSGGTSSVSALLLDPELEQEIRNRHEREALLDDAAWCDRVLDAIAAAAPAWGQIARPVCLLTTLDTRSATRRLVALELPHVPVLAFQDLAPDANITVLERIKLADAPTHG